VDYVALSRDRKDGVTPLELKAAPHLTGVKLNARFSKELHLSREGRGTLLIVERVRTTVSRRQSNRAVILTLVLFFLNTASSPK
jgi:hypothetical protein